MATRADDARANAVLASSSAELSSNAAIASQNGAADSKAKALAAYSSAKQSEADAFDAARQAADSAASAESAANHEIAAGKLHRFDGHERSIERGRDAPTRCWSSPGSPGRCDPPWVAVHAHYGRIAGARCGRGGTGCAHGTSRRLSAILATRERGGRLSRTLSNGRRSLERHASAECD